MNVVIFRIKLKDKVSKDILKTRPLRSDNYYITERNNLISKEAGYKRSDWNTSTKLL